MINMKDVCLAQIAYKGQIKTSEKPMEEPYYDYPFYLSAYECPKCGRSLYKSVIQEGCEVEFMTKDIFRESSPKRSVIVKRVFTCCYCRHYLFSYPGRNLDDYDLLAGNVVFILPCSDYATYEKVMEFFSSICTTAGRLDYNEFGETEIGQEAPILEKIPTR